MRAQPYLLNKLQVYYTLPSSNFRSEGVDMSSMFRVWFKSNTGFLRGGEQLPFPLHISLASVFNLLDSIASFMRVICRKNKQKH